MVEVLFEFSYMVYVHSTAAPVASQGQQENTECLAWEDCNLSLTSVNLLIFLEKQINYKRMLTIFQILTSFHLFSVFR